MTWLRSVSGRLRCGADVPTPRYTGKKMAPFSGALASPHPTMKGATGCSETNGPVWYPQASRSLPHHASHVYDSMSGAGNVVG